MKTSFTFSAILVTAIIAFTSLVSFRSILIGDKDMIGAWGYGPPENRTVLIHTNNIFSVATYDIPGKKFISSYGGTWRLEGSRLLTKIEWNSKDTSQVRKEISTDVNIVNDQLIMKQTNERWNKLEDGQRGDLTGAWIITGNFINDTASKRSNPFYPRRTMKVLSGKHFQWIAYNVVTKAFMNAGGGTYSTDNGKYTENIEFFTKTSESVGKSVTFNYSFVNGDWRHKGQKSTGGPLDECWSRRETLEK